MTDNFPSFANLVAASLQDMMSTGDVFVAAVDGDALYAQYLAAFPEGADPIHKKKSEHDCSCCRQFIRRVGNLVSKGGVTVWDEASARASHPYDAVAKKLRDAVADAEISDLFAVGEREGAFGASETHSRSESGEVRTWHHFYTGSAIPSRLRHASPDAVRGEYRTTVQVFIRGLTELDPSAVDAVLALVDANSLYRGEEHRPALLAFQRAQREFLALDLPGRERYVWTQARGTASRFRNTVIGTLVQDLSEGVDVERAVASFEQKVAPTNYKRTTAVITPAMVKNAMKIIEVLGLEPALERRHAVVGDVSVRDVKWVDGGVRPLMRGGIGALLWEHAEAAASPKIVEGDEARAEEVAIDDFVSKILPEAEGVEILLKGEHLGNLMTLTAPTHPEPRQLFRWDNDFAWSYGGNVADSIKERVKRAGGRVEGATLRASLSWFNYDDLDLHVLEPAGRGIHGAGGHIYYASKLGWTGGILDVDMNAGGGRTREAVENVVWAGKVPDGTYKIVVNNFAQRETSDVGFVVEVESGGRLSHFSYNKTVRNKADIHVCDLHVRNGFADKIEPGDYGITAANISQEKWGLKTEQYARVKMVTLSPNYWGGNAVGNRHTFFVLEGAKCDEPMRGFYSEFLHPRLEPHRKVFEVIGDKTKCPPSEEQLSGLGFSSTKEASLIVKVRQGKKQRIFRVRVGA